MTEPVQPGKRPVTVVIICATAVTVAALGFAAFILATTKDVTLGLTAVMTLLPLTVGTLVTQMFTLIRTDEVRHNVNGRMSQMVELLGKSAPVDKRREDGKDESR